MDKTEIEEVGRLTNLYIDAEFCLDDQPGKSMGKHVFRFADIDILEHWMYFQRLSNSGKNKAENHWGLVWFGFVFTPQVIYNIENSR